ncbi:acyl-CoA dehydrogenase family protein [Chloroflexus sp.]|uniref:acyl-CoA dehydrogenase family protein n=1 Tax=Chloroflexus sp. TaxID=1904827 RepID=UPI00261F17D2|nr:acyl-CoA dehydrogenase family protein [uncultured Chloroflexus sp.]
MSDLFRQQPPQLGNQYTDDRVLRSFLCRVLPRDALAQAEPDLITLGELAGTELYHLQLADRRNEPVLTQWDAWGERIDQIELSPLWRRAARLAAQYGLVALPYERSYGALSRIVQFALVYLFHPSTDVYTCPLAMSDGAARTLLQAGDQLLIERALPRLISRDPDTCWTSGQWMTELPGGSDVSQTETIARPDGDGGWRLFGRKWFTSATTGQMALALARPEGNPSGSRGLALFYVELRDAAGRLQGIRVNRLKDKLGTRKVPTAELSLEGAPARLVGAPNGGVRAIVPMLQVTRIWNSISAVSFMRRGIALARDYARRRVVFGAPLSRQPLHIETLATLQAEFEGAFHLSFLTARLLGAEEAGIADERQRQLLRVLTSIAKLTTARQAVAVMSEVVEAFGGAGYIEDTGLPVLLRDAQVLPIWEGTTNVLALDTMRALTQAGAWEALTGLVAELTAAATSPQLVAAGERARNALAHARHWFTAADGRDYLERGARRLALTIGRSLELALLVDHASWSFAAEHDGRAQAAALRFARSPVDLIDEFDHDDMALADDTPLPVDG